MFYAEFEGVRLLFGARSREDCAGWLDSLSEAQGEDADAPNERGFAVMMAGYLLKQGGEHKTFRRRYFQLTSNGLLSYYSSNVVRFFSSLCSDH